MAQPEVLKVVELDEASRERLERFARPVALIGLELGEVEAPELPETFTPVPAPDAHEETFPSLKAATQAFNDIRAKLIEAGVFTE